MTSNRILVLGSNGQVGRSIKEISSRYSSYSFLFKDRNEIDIADAKSILLIKDLNINAIINAAAYTAVDLAESDASKAWLVNASSPKLISKLCAVQGIPLIHFSSDYVYDNGKVSPLMESDPCSPKSIYAVTKFEGEQAALYYNPKTIIIRTSWVYSEFGNNFVKTILKLSNEKPELNVVNDQIGAPTYAGDLASVTLVILDAILSTAGFTDYGIYNYSNEGKISWFDFAAQIATEIKSNSKIHAVGTDDFPRPAKRPSYSVFDMAKIKTAFGINPIGWKKSLRICIQNLSRIVP